ncbi:MAG: type II toxin-antitoxin system VapC family toxin [Gammaproteobacteria bacterium]
MSFLLDTCAISELAKPTPDAGLLRWLQTADESGLYLSVITLGEIQKGIAALTDSKKKRTLERWLETDLVQRFAERILTFGVEEAACWGSLLGSAERKGEVLPVTDAMIAAIAVQHDLTIVTRNTKDFVRFPVKIENPWLR